jgi:hypothetical protein
MVLSLEGRRPEVGRAGASLCRQAPHLICQDFLAALGERREWVAGRHRLDAAKALTLVLEHVQAACAGTRGLLWSVPPYLARTQVALVAPVARKARLPLLGAVRAPLAVALAAYSTEPWSGTALVLDADEHAFSATAVVADGQQLTMQIGEAWPQLNVRVWKGRLLDVVADRCVRQSRRDPRDSAPAEQSLYDQLEDALEASGRGKVIELLIQTPNWYQNLSLRPDEIAAVCSRLVNHVMHGIRTMLAGSVAQEPPRAVLLTQAAGRLPGLVSAVQSFIQEQPPARELDPSGDFGEDLLLQTNGGPATLTVLAADAPARAAHYLATRIDQQDLPGGFHDFVLPLPHSDARSLLSPPNKRNLRILSPDQP